MAAEWPYEARQDDPLTAMRIPVIGHAWPGWAYLVAFDCGELDGEETRPDDAEVLMLLSFLAEYKAYWYRGNAFELKMAERPFDVDGGANGTIFRKWGDGDWGYRKRTWSTGPTYVPDHPRIRGGAKALTLEQVMDRVHTVGRNAPDRRWLDWKAAHPDVFGGAR